MEPSNNKNTAPPADNPFAASGLFMKSADTWSPFKMSAEGFAGGGKTFTLCCAAVGIWMAEGRTGNVILQDTEKSVKFIIPFFRQFGLIEGKNFFVTHSRDLLVWNKLLNLCEQNRGTIFMTDTVTHVYEQMMVQFERDNGRKVKYPQDALVIKPMWKEKFSTPFTNAVNTHLLFTGRAAFEYSMMTDEDTGKKSFEATGVKMRGDNELLYEPDVVLLMERAQHMEDSRVMIARKATVLKDRSRQIDGKEFLLFTEDEQGKKYTDEQLQKNAWSIFEPVYKILATGNKTVEPPTESDKALGTLFTKGGGEAFYQQRLRAERTVEEIVGVYNQWGLGGSGGAEKSVRAILNNLIFNVRSTAGLVEIHPDRLTAGVDTIDYLSRFAAKHMEFIDKAFNASQFDKITDFFTEAKVKYEEELERAKQSQSPTVQLPPSDDDIPEFASKPSPQQPTEAPKPQGAVAPNLGISPEDKKAIEAATTRDTEDTLMDAKKQGDLDAKFAEFGAVISGLSEENRKRVHRAYNTKRTQLRRAGSSKAEEPSQGEMV